MSTHSPVSAPEPFNSNDKAMRVVIAKTEWNAAYTEPLTQQACERLEQLGVKTTVVTVPGAVELGYAATSLQSTRLYDAIIVIGCVIKGDTPHFHYVCKAATDSVAALNLRGLAPVIFGVLTVDNDARARERVEGGKGTEWADTAAKMIRFRYSMKEPEPGICMVPMYKRKATDGPC